MKFPFIHQLEANDCAPTCIQMITAHYGQKLSLEKLKELCNLTRQGITALDIVECFKRTGFKATAISISKIELQRMPLPSILFWRQEHYVVLYNIEKTKKENIYHIADPSYGRIKLGEEAFEKSWINGQKGIAIAMQPSEVFYEASFSQEKPESAFKKIYQLSRSITKQHPKSISFTFILILISIALNWAMPIILQKVIDDGVLKHDISMVWKLMLFQLFFFCGYTVSDALSSIILTKINFKEGIKYLAEYLYKLVKLPVKFFDTRLNTDLIQRMEDQEKVQNFLTYRFIEQYR